MRRKKWRRKTDLEAVDPIILDCDISRKKFTGREDDIIRHMVRIGATNKEIAIELDRTESSIRSRRVYMNMSKTERWTQTEVEYLVDNILLDANGVTKNISQLTNHFVNHDKNAVYHKIANLREVGRIPKITKNGALEDSYFRKTMWGGKQC